MTQPLRSTTDDGIIEAMRGGAHPLNGSAQDYDPLIDLIGDARLVLLGAASHGTHEFYSARAQIPSDSSKKKGLRPLRRKPIGPPPTGLTGTCAA